MAPIVRGFRHAVLWLSCALLLASCGGAEVIALLAVVTPLGGFWRSDDATPQTIQLTVVQPEKYLYSAQLDLTADLVIASAVCGPQPLSSSLDATLDNGKLLVFEQGSQRKKACLEGSFTDLRTLRMAATGQPAIVFHNNRVDVAMDRGLWSTDGSTAGLTLKFESPTSVDDNVQTDTRGCTVSATLSSTAFVGRMQGFVESTGAVPRIPDLTKEGATDILFREVTFRDGAKLELIDNSTGKSVVLHRKQDPVVGGTRCPPP